AAREHAVRGVQGRVPGAHRPADAAAAPAPRDGAAGPAARLAARRHEGLRVRRALTGAVPAGDALRGAVLAADGRALAAPAAGAARRVDAPPGVPAVRR